MMQHTEKAGAGRSGLAKEPGRQAQRIGLLQPAHCPARCSPRPPPPPARPSLAPSHAPPVARPPAAHRAPHSSPRPRSAAPLCRATPGCLQPLWLRCARACPRAPPPRRPAARPPVRRPAAPPPSRARPPDLMPCCVWRPVCCPHRSPAPLHSAPRRCPRSRCASALAAPRNAPLLSSLHGSRSIPPLVSRLASWRAHIFAHCVARMPRRWYLRFRAGASPRREWARAQVGWGRRVGSSRAFKP